MRLLPIGEKKLVNLNHVFSINLEKPAIIFNSITGVFTTASVKDFGGDEKLYRIWKKKVIKTLKARII